MKKLLVIIGTRPEAIKMAPVVLACRNRREFAVEVCVTGQHRTMLDQVLEFFGISPDQDLAVMERASNLAEVTAAIVTGLPPVIARARPDLVLVHGDTNTTFSAALAAFYTGTPVAHVEAGLRTGNINAPWPEEMNRRLTASIADFHFAPTDRARDNLLRENIRPDRIWVTGNTVIDALFQARQLLRDSNRADLDQKFSFFNTSRRLVLVTGHRRENFGEGIQQICAALVQLAKREDVEIVYPVHLNPNVVGPVGEILRHASNIHLIDPLDYRSFVHLMDLSYIILTDSGGIQEEAPSLGKPVLVMREVTERPEAVEAGTVRLVGANTDRIVNEVSRLLDDSELYARMSSAHNPYGDGRAAERIGAFISEALNPEGDR